MSTLLPRLPWGRALRIACRVFVTTAALTSVGICNEPTIHQRFRAAAKNVDRVSIWRVEPRSLEDNPDNAPCFEVRGHDLVERLVEAMEFLPEPDGLSDPCLCLGTHRFEFHRGERFKFELTYHHWDRLRGGLGGPWVTDAVLSERGADRLIEWFSSHGFDEFARQRAMVVEAQSKLEERRQEIAALLPEGARDWLPGIHHNSSWSPEVRERSGHLALVYEDKADMILTVWDALGLMAERPGAWMLEVTGEPGTFLIKALDSATEADIHRALSQLPGANERMWLGAMRHFASLRWQKEKQGEWGSEWPVRLADFYFDRGPQRHRDSLIRTVALFDTPAAEALLLKIGEAAVPRAVPTSAASRTFGSAGPPEVSALLHLAERRVSAALRIIDEKLATAPEGDDRLALEIARAHFDRGPEIRAEHLRCEADMGRAAELAWAVALKRGTERRDAEVLAAAANSPSYNVVRDAESRLAKLGFAQAYGKRTAEGWNSRSSRIERSRRGAGVHGFAFDTPGATNARCSAGSPWARVFGNR